MLINFFNYYDKAYIFINLKNKRQKRTGSQFELFATTMFF